MIERDLRLTLGLVPLLMGVLAVGLIVFGGVALVTSALVALWGLVFGTVPQPWPRTTLHI